MEEIGKIGRGERTEPQYNILGFTEYDLIDYVDGFAEGIYQKNVTEEYDTCVLGVPRYAYEIYEISQNIKINSWSLDAIMKNFEEIEESVQLIITMISEAPKEFEACSNLWTDVSETFNWLLHHLSPVQLIGNIFGNLATHMVAFATDTWGLIAALLHHDMYTFGKDLAELIMMLIN